MDIKDKIISELKPGIKMTIPQICIMIDEPDEMAVVSVIAELESDNKVLLKSMLPFYAPSGDVAYLAEYGLVTMPNQDQEDDTPACATCGTTTEELHQTTAGMLCWGCIEYLNMNEQGE